MSGSRNGEQRVVPLPHLDVEYRRAHSLHLESSTGKAVSILKEESGFGEGEVMHSSSCKEVSKVKDYESWFMWKVGFTNMGKCFGRDQWKDNT